MFRLKFEIQGQIAEASQKDKISFISLISQIHEAQARSYNEKDIISAIMWAFTQSLSVRTYLETITDLKLPRLLQILRSHFKEKSATELYQELSTMTQEPGEDENKFLMTTLEVRRKVLFASEADETTHYNPALVQGLFLQTVEVGLIQEAICTQIRPYLLSKTTSEELISHMGKTIAAETERGKRLPQLTQKQSKVVRLQGIEGIHIDSPLSEKAENMQFAQAVQALSEQVAALTAEVAQLKAHNKPNEKVKQQPRGTICKHCQDPNRTFCNHCFLYDSENHYARGCKQAKGLGNDRRLQQGGTAVVGETDVLQKCNYCDTEGKTGETLLRCIQCHSVVYCSRKSQKRGGHITNHSARP